MGACGVLAATMINTYTTAILTDHFGDEPDTEVEPVQRGTYKEDVLAVEGVVPHETPMMAPGGRGLRATVKGRKY